MFNQNGNFKILVSIFATREQYKMCMYYTNIESITSPNKLIYIKTNSFLYLVRNFSITSFSLRQDLKISGFFSVPER